MAGEDDLLKILQDPEVSKAAHDLEMAELADREKAPNENSADFKQFSTLPFLYKTNRTFGRIKSMQCSRDETNPNDPKAFYRQQLKEKEQRYQDHVSGKNPLPPEESVPLRKEVMRLSEIVEPEQNFAWPALSKDEQAYVAAQYAAERRAVNSIGIAAAGPVLGGLPAAGRVLGAPEAAVENLAIINVDLVGALALGGRGRSLKPASTGTRASSQISSGPKPASPGNGTYVAKQYSSLNWQAVVPKKGKYKGESREDHVRRHNVDDPTKDQHGIFKDDGVDTTTRAWNRAQDLGLSPNANGELIVPMGETVGTSGGALGTGLPLNRVRIIVQPGTNNIITSMPY